VAGDAAAGRDFAELGKVPGADVAAFAAAGMEAAVGRRVDGARHVAREQDAALEKL